MEKKFCTTHHFFYTKADCPFCQQEKYHKWAKKLHKKEENNAIKETDENKEITNDMLNSLKAKFGC